eukprot:g4071.t1
MVGTAVIVIISVAALPVTLLLLLAAFMLCFPSKMSKFHAANSSLTFRIMYHIYTTPLGQLVHDHMDMDKSREPHTEFENKRGSVIQLNAQTEVHIVPVLKDNYCYIIVDKQSGHAAVVDASDAAAISSSLESMGRDDVRLTHILSTHDHFDHTGANRRLLRRNRALIIVGGKDDDVPCCNRRVSDGDIIPVGANTKVRVIHCPCHTVGHCAFYIEEREGQGALFSGDALFVGGCGKFFEGSARDMRLSLAALMSLPPNTLLFPGHEYAEANLKFAHTAVLPKSSAIKELYAKVKELRKSKLPAVPSTLAEEAQTNVFCMAAVGGADLTSSPILTGPQRDGLNARNGSVQEDVLCRLRILKDSL